MSYDPVIVHSLNVEGGQTAKVMVNNDGHVAFVYGDVELPEATLVIRARCAFNADVLDVPTCECADRSRVALSVARRAPLGVFVYLTESTVESFAGVLELLGQLSNLERLFLPFPAVGDLALLRDATNYGLLHAPTAYPADDAAWPRPPSANPRWYARLRDRIKEVLVP